MDTASDGRQAECLAESLVVLTRCTAHTTDTAESDEADNRRPVTGRSLVMMRGLDAGSRLEGLSSTRETSHHHVFA